MIVVGGKRRRQQKALTAKIMVFNEKAEPLLRNQSALSAIKMHTADLIGVRAENAAYWYRILQGTNSTENRIDSLIVPWIKKDANSDHICYFCRMNGTCH